MKYWILGLSLLAAACANTVEVKDKADFKCGTQIVHAEYLDDDTMVLRINGISNVLTRVASSNGKRYENIASGMAFMQQDGDFYLSIMGQNYPQCRKIVK